MMRESEFAPPRKSLGQNFLQDDNIIDKIVASLGLQSSDTVVEVGPGRGALTERLLFAPQQLHIIEYDRALVGYWQQRASSESRLVVHSGDVLHFDLGAVSKSTKSIKVVGNLPYHISSPVLFHFMPFAELIERQVFMLQNEVVERMVAHPGSKQYGRLSVMLQYRYQMEKLFSVLPNSFYPPPKVKSAVVKMTPRIAIQSPVRYWPDFECVVKQAFAQRRKTLRNTLKALIAAHHIDAAGIDPGLRAESLSVEDFVTLANRYTQLENPGE